MSTTTNEVQVGILFEDGTTRKYALPNVAAEDLSGVKGRVQAINNGSAGDGATYQTAMKATFVSNTGSPMLKIGSCSIIRTTEEVIYSA